VTLTVFTVLSGAALFGEALLRLIGASLPASQVGGGLVLVLLLMALAMLNAKVGEMRQTSAEAAELEAGELSGVVPLAVPLLAGPGAIGTTIIAAQAGGVAHTAALIGCIALVCGLLWWILRVADVAPRMGTTGLNIATRLLGLLLGGDRDPDHGRRPQAAFPGAFLASQSSIARRIASGCSVGIQCSASRTTNSACGSASRMARARKGSIMVLLRETSTSAGARIAASGGSGSPTAARLCR